MSSILKALKKLEAEKALTEEVAGINVSREILRQQPANRKAVFWLSIVGIVAIAVIATLTALLLAKSPRQQEAHDCQHDRILGNAAEYRGSQQGAENSSQYAAD